MSAKTLFLGLMAMSGALSACHPTESTHSVEWFKANHSALNDTLAKCNGNPGELAATPNCINASRARNAITWNTTGGGVKAEPIEFGKKERNHDSP